MKNELQFDQIRMDRPKKQLGQYKPLLRGTSFLEK